VEWRFSTTQLAPSSTPRWGDTLGPQVDELPPLPDEVIYKVAAILHQHSEEESGSKRWPLDAMNTGHAAVTWFSTVGIGSIRVRRFARGWRPCNGGWDEVGRR
jgi:hypothetical protein